MWVKVCGLTREADIECAIEAGADAVGLVLVERSPRAIDQGLACELAAISAGRATVVLLLDASPSAALAALEAVGADAVQPYGPEASAVAAAAREAGIGVLLPIAVAADMEPDLSGVTRGVRPLLETSIGGSVGGTGVAFDWTRARQVPGAVIAGGLGPDNVADAVAIARPWGVDASSRLEAEAGIKDHGKVIAFVTAARSAAASL